MSGLKLESQEAVWGKGLAVQQYHLLETLLEVLTPWNQILTENTRGFFKIQTRVWTTPPAPNAVGERSTQCPEPGMGRTFKGEFVSCRFGIG